MEEKKKNEELKSRREFFKEAAKKALPVLGAIVLANAPIMSQAAEKEPMGCNGSCTGFCTGGCYTSCQGGCKGGCEVVCNSACVTTCKGGCQGCSNTCRTSVNHY